MLEGVRVPYEAIEKKRLDGLAPPVRGGRLLNGRALTPLCRFESCGFRSVVASLVSLFVGIKKGNTSVAPTDHDVAEWRGAGLQSRRRGFDSRRRVSGSSSVRSEVLAPLAWGARLEIGKAGDGRPCGFESRRFRVG